jgi:hypothetical protein
MQHYSIFDSLSDRIVAIDLKSTLYEPVSKE